MRLPRVTICQAPFAAGRGCPARRRGMRAQATARTRPRHVGDATRGARAGVCAMQLRGRGVRAPTAAGGRGIARMAQGA